MYAATTGAGGRAALALLACALLLAAGCLSPQTRLQAPDEEPVKDLGVMTIGDVTDVGNAGPMVVSGIGLVVGLEGTGGSPTGNLRTMLEEDLRKKKVRNGTELLNSPNNALVTVTAIIPPGARKGDPIDVEVALPQGSKATSLRGGYLMDCHLRVYESTRNLAPEHDRENRILGSNVFAKAAGPLLVGIGGPDDEDRQRKGRIWEGGVSFIDRPFYLVLKNDQKFAKVANAVANRINASFQDDPKRRFEALQHKRLMVLGEVANQLNETFKMPSMGKGETAKAANPEVVYVKAPWEYRLNPERYLRVVRLVPLQESPETAGKYRDDLQEMLLDPAQAVRAALRLEALGKGSMPALREGLKSEHPLVRFCAAEALTYLGSTSGVEELATLAAGHDSLRAWALMALASLDEPVCSDKLAELMTSPHPELRYGAFRALRLLKESQPDPRVGGEQFNESFWVHRVASESPPLVHFTVSQRAEVVLFGKGHVLTPPLKLLAGQEFTVTADAGEGRCNVGRFMHRQGKIERRQCSLRLDDVLRTMGEMGAQYTDVVELLRSLEEQRGLTCSVRVNALPGTMAIEDLAASGRRPDFWRVGPAVPQDSGIRQVSTRQ
jgi:hypothetical protein